MSRETRRYYEDFEDEVDASELLRMFDNKKKRVDKIFDDSDSEDTAVNNEKSYGLRLKSIGKSNSDSLAAQPTSDKENANEPRKSKSNELAKNSNVVKALSPVPIIPATVDQISESPKSPFRRPSQRQLPQSDRLRRSLFQNPPVNLNPNLDIICSTPFSINRQQNNFFESTSSQTIPNFSPIRNSDSNNVLTEEDLNGFRIINAEKNTAKVIVEPIPSLQNLEEDLRKQYSINEMTPKKSYSKSEITKKTNKASVPSPSNVSFRSEPAKKKLNQNTISKECSVRIEPMDMSKETISMYRKSQMSRLSTSNRTNVNTFNMIETPVIRQAKKSVINDSALAKKLALCDSDSDSQMTNDKSNSPEKKSGKNSLKSSQQQKLQVVGTNEVTDDESAPSNYQTPESDRQSASSTVKNSYEVANTHSNGETFRKPNGIAATRRLEVMSNMSNSSANTLVPIDIIKSFHGIQKPTNETTQMSENQSLKVTIPPNRNKRTTKNKKTENVKAMDYLELGKQVQKTKNIKSIKQNDGQKKRSLYFQRSFIEDDSVGEQQLDKSHSQKTTHSFPMETENAEESDNGLKNTVENNHCSTDSESVATSDLLVPIETPVKNAKKKKVNQKKPIADGKKKQTIEDSSDEEVTSKPVKERKNGLKSKKINPKKDEKPRKNRRKIMEDISDDDDYTPEPAKGTRKKIPKKSSQIESQSMDIDDDTDSELRNTVEEIRQSLASESMSNSQILQTPVKNTKQRENEKNSEVAQDSSDEKKTLVPVRVKAKKQTSNKNKNVQPEPGPSNRAVTQGNENDKDMELIQEEEQPKRRLRTRKQQNVASQKPATRKRHSNSEDTENEPPKKTNRIAPISDGDNEEEGEANDNSELISKISDEGFQSDKEEDNIRYNPYDRGCQRPGLRVRRYPRAYWIHTDEQYYIMYGTFTKKDAQAETLRKKYRININSFQNDNFLAPSSKLEELQEKIMSDKIKARTKKRKEKEQPQQKKSDEEVQERMETETVASGETARTADTHAGFVNRIFENFNAINGTTDKANNITTYSSAGFDMSQINRLVWIQVDHGVFYSSFKEGGVDGFMKFERGSTKKNAKTKHSVIKLTLLCGKLEVIINHDKVTINNLGFVSIHKGQSYKIVNSGEETAIALVTRLDSQDLK